MKHYFFPILLVSFCSLAAEPNWLHGDKKISDYQQTAVACVDVNNNLEQAKLIANTIAQGNMVQERGGEVTAVRELITSTVESHGVISTSEKLNEIVRVKSHYKLTELITIKSGQYNIQGAKNYCVLLGIAKKGVENEL